MTNRVVDLERGRVMVVTDLHGDWLAYWHYCKRFLELRARGEADTLIFAGDLIHSEGPEAADYSLEMVLDLLHLRQELGERLIVLLGNHELPHLYGFPLSKGDVVYTPRFEKALGEYRADILAFFDSLPFFVRTRAGVAVAHAGASRAGATLRTFQALKSYSHAAELALVDSMLAGQDRDSLRAGLGKLNAQSYGDMAEEFLGITSPLHPRYDDLLRGLFVQSWSENFQHLWDALINRNEHEYGEGAYRSHLNHFLDHLSAGFVPQRFLVCGHIGVPAGGAQVVLGKQLRLASWTHAAPPEAGEYLLFDAGRPVQTMDALKEGLDWALPARH
jgi:hypothetical protein